MGILPFLSLIFVASHFPQFATTNSLWRLPSVENEKYAVVSNERSDEDEDDDDIGMCRHMNDIVANRKNCSQFYICRGAELGATLGLCPPGMWFDPEHTDNDDVVCIHPEVACTNNQIDMFKYCKCRDRYPLGIQAANANTDDTLLETSARCIIDNEFHVYASAVDCERYFICFNGRVKRMQCKTGLHFNAAHGYCDHPIDANCQIVDRKCPPTGISFIRHSLRCDAYYYCLNGDKSLQHCGFNRKWNEKMASCVPRDPSQADS